MDEVKKRIYLSLPISGYDLDERRAVAMAKRQELEKKGFLVVSPLDNGLPADAGTHAHMRRDFEMMLGCDAVYFMNRWCHSAGCHVEFMVATACGMQIFFEECHNLENKCVKFM